MKKNKINIFEKENYIIKFNILKEDDFWLIGEKENIEVKTPHNIIKNNHIGAEKAFMKKYQGRDFKIIGVSYV